MASPYSSLLGIVVGVGVALILPATEQTAGVLAEISVIIRSLGGYFLLPLIFFSLPVAVTRLRRLSRLERVMSQTALSIVISSGTLTIVGTVIAWTYGSGGYR